MINEPTPTRRNEMTEWMYPDKITAEEFIEIITDKEYNQAFIKNMKKINDKIPEKLLVEDWIQLYCSWLEINQATVEE